jgi:hypothetical protein
MRRSATIALLLVAVMNTAAIACVAEGSGRNRSATSCKLQDSCARKSRANVLAGRSCARTMHSPVERCHFHGFVQAYFAEPSSAAPLAIGLVRTAIVPVPESKLVIISSIDAPHTDRGPPRA